MVVKLIRMDKTDYHRKLIQNFKHRPKQFYGYTNKMRTVKKYPILHAKMVVRQLMTRKQRQCYAAALLHTSL